VLACAQAQAHDENFQNASGDLDTWYKYLNPGHEPMRFVLLVAGINAICLAGIAYDLTLTN